MIATRRLLSLAEEDEEEGGPVSPLWKKLCADQQDLRDMELKLNKFRRLLNEPTRSVRERDGWVQRQYDQDQDRFDEIYAHFCETGRISRVKMTTKIRQEAITNDELQKLLFRRKPSSPPPVVTKKGGPVLRSSTFKLGTRPGAQYMAERKRSSLPARKSDSSKATKPERRSSMPPTENATPKAVDPPRSSTFPAPKDDEEKLSGVKLEDSSPKSPRISQAVEPPTTNKEIVHSMEQAVSGAPKEQGPVLNILRLVDLPYRGGGSYSLLVGPSKRSHEPMSFTLGTTRSTKAVAKNGAEECVIGQNVMLPDHDALYCLAVLRNDKLIGVSQNFNSSDPRLSQRKPDWLQIYSTSGSKKSVGLAMVRCGLPPGVDFPIVVESDEEEEDVDELDDIADTEPKNLRGQLGLQKEDDEDDEDDGEWEEEEEEYEDY